MGFWVINMLSAPFLYLFTTLCFVVLLYAKFFSLVGLHVCQHLLTMCKVNNFMRYVTFITSFFCVETGIITFYDCE